MSPYDTLRQRYLDHPEAQPFEFYEYVHQQSGFFFATPDFCIMGRPVISTAPRSDVTECTYEFQRDACDCWFVHAFAGNLNRVWDILPWYLPLVAWERDRFGGKDLQVVPLSSIKRLSRQENEHQHRSLSPARL